MSILKVGVESVLKVVGKMWTTGDTGGCVKRALAENGCVQTDSGKSLSTHLISLEHGSDHITTTNAWQSAVAPIGP